MTASSEEKPIEGLADDLEFWMTNLPQRLRSVPIIYLAIPGSHDSATYAISRKSEVSPDAEAIVKNLSFLGPLLTAFVAKWSRTQIFTITDQLKSGIRYFDLRIATKAGTDQLYFVHGLYSVPAAPVLVEIKEFLETHPQEVVILDCQHFYAFQQSDHEKLMYLLNSTFSHKMVPFSPHMRHLSLEFMTTQFRYQVIAVYRSDASRFGQPLLWPSVSFPTPWPDTTSIPQLINALEDGLKNRDNMSGYVTQCVLTPTTWFVFKHLFSSLKSKCVLPLEKQKYSWLNRQKPGYGGINIVISDFVDYSESQFAREVIGLNAKMFESPKRSNQKSAMTPVD